MQGAFRDPAVCQAYLMVYGSYSLHICFQDCRCRSRLLALIILLCGKDHCSHALLWDGWVL